MATIYDNPDSILATTAKLLDAEGLSAALNVLKSAQAKFEKTGYDNYDGGTDIYTLYLRVDPAQFAQLGGTRETIETQIGERLKTVTDQYVHDWLSIKIVPLVTKDPSWRSEVGEIPRSVRQDIFDVFRLSHAPWSGEQDDVEFLARIFDLKAQPSFDPRFKDAAGDIWQHRINNFDWEDDWVFSDSRFNLADGPHNIFLKFVCETVHPAVRKDRSIAVTLVQQINRCLEACGWELYEEELIAGKPRYKARKIVTATKRASTRAKSVADALEAGWMHQEIIRLENAVEKDPSLAIGTAKELIETCCKTILGKLGGTVPNDFSDLTKAVIKKLDLVPDQIPDKAKGADKIRVILRNLTALPNELAGLRAFYGSGHGRDGRHNSLETRHARLAVGAAVTFIDFITDTYHKRLIKEDAPQHEKTK